MRYTRVDVVSATGAGTEPISAVLWSASGDPSFDTPDHIRDAGIAAIRGGHTHYSAPMGEADLRRAVASYLTTLGGGTFEAEHVLITNGASSGIYASMVAYLDPGDEVLLHDPCYSLYWDVARSAGAVAVFVPWTDKLRLDFVHDPGPIDGRASPATLDAVRRLGTRS